MKKIKYKDQNKKNYKIIPIVLFVLVFILFFALFLLNKLEKTQEENIIEYDNISTIKDVIEYHKSKYISENKSAEKGFYLDIYVKFVVPLYKGDESNQEYYDKLLEDCARILRYESFKIIDDENDIIIKIICNGQKITSIIINDIEDYFIYKDSQISMKKYEEIKTTDFSVQSEVLQRCIDNDWSSNTYLGERDSIFDNYNIYFDEGIKARIIDGKIYNIIFTERYAGNIIQDISTANGIDYVTTILGKPTFQDEGTRVIGYKGTQFYVFFTGDEISIYRNSSIDSDDFFELSDRYTSGKLNLLDFMNELTYMWPDYTEYIYGKKNVYITYPLKGIEIRINYGDINGILVYNNNKSNMSKISRYLENTIFVGRLQKDLVYEAEKSRFEVSSKLLNRCREYEETLSEAEKNRIGTSMKYSIYAEKDVNGYIYSMKFISQFGEEPNRELNDGIFSYLWVNNDYFLFSKSGIGVYFYNLNTGRVQKIDGLSGNETYELKEYKDGILKYDDKKAMLQF